MPTRTTPAAASAALAPKPQKAARRRVRRRRPRVSRLLAWLLAAWLGPMGLSLAQVAPGTLPSGGQVVVGNGVLQHNPNLLVIQQNSQRLGLDWQSFNIGAGATVEFRQPGASSVALNRVLGNSGTEIYGQLRANGQVFLTNPNGVLFAPGAKVDVGGLVASTLDLSQQDFADGRYVFQHTGGRGAVVNQGSLTASAGGYLALFGNQVRNQGDISVDAGSVVLASGRAATVSISGSGLLSAVVTPGALDGRVDNSGRISADGSVVTLTAQSAQDIAASLVNNSGIVRANTLVEKAGEIWITGDRVASSGTLSVAAPQGGDAGRIVAKGDLSNGSLQLDGRIDATAAQGRGGNVETSAAHVAIARDTRVDSRGGAATGTWLIDPTDFTIAAGGGAQTTSGIGADTLANNLANTNIALATAAGGSEPGDIHVNAAVSWSANTTLTLQAARDINFNASLTATGATAGLVLTTGAGGSVNVNITDSNRPTVSLGGNNATLTINNLGYTLVRDLAGLQAMSGGLAGRYALMADIDASSTATNGFVPIGNEASASVTSTGAFTGVFDGLGHRITGLTINRPTSNATGLFASTNGATLRNFELTGGAVSGSQYTGAVVGYTRGATLLHNIRSSNSVAAMDDGSAGVWAGGLVGLMEGSTGAGVLRSVATGNVSAGSNTSVAYAGGLAGEMDSGLLTSVSASGNVTVTLNTGSNDAGHFAGGLVGLFNGGNITTVSASGTISGGHESGGLIGRLQPTSSSTLNQASASGNVTGTGNVGGLVGYALGTGAITNASATGSVSTSTPDAQSFHAGGAIGRYAMNGAPVAVSAQGNVSGGNTTGGVVGWIESNVALVAGSLVSVAPTDPQAVKTVTGARWVGGLIGYSDSNSAFSGLTSNAAVTATGNQGSVGGLIGRSNGALSNSTSAGSVTGVGDIGGLVGRAQGAGGLSNVSSSASVISTGTGFSAGGLVGYYTNTGNLGDAGASGAVQGPTGTGSYAGGLVGFFNTNASLVTVSTATTSSVTGGGDIGGLVGQASGGGTSAITGATSRGSVTGAPNAGYVGGLVGQYALAGAWSNVSAEGQVTGGNATGGVAGYYSSSAAISNGSYVPSSISGGTWVGGVVGYMGTTAAISGASANNPWVVATQVNATATGGAAGGVVGRSAGVVSNITTTGSINASAEAGGVVGRADGSGGLSNLRASGNVSSSLGSAAVGGVVGNQSNSGGLNNATATGNVSGGRYTGGVLGYYSGSGNLQTLRAEGNVSGTGDVGGVIGYASGAGTLSDADALGTVTSSATATYSVGGAVGYFGLTGGLSDITAAGNVSGGTQTGGVIGAYNPTTAITAGALTYINSASRSVTGVAWVGGLIGHSNASAITGHSVAAAVTGTGTSGAAGGLAGRTGGSVSNSSATGAVVSAAGAGGLVGQADGTATFTDVTASGAVRGRTDVGGLVGSFNSSATILRGTASGDVSTASSGGGLVGAHYGGAITSSSATGHVTGLSDGTVYLGGLVGLYGNSCYFCPNFAVNVITDSSATGSVRADAGGSYSGGLVGIVYGGVINNSNASGAVTSRDSVSTGSNAYVGGLVGYFGYYGERGTITGSNATGAVTGGYYNGGLVGLYNGGAISSSTASGSVSGGHESGGLIGYATLYGPMNNVSATGAVNSADTSGSGAGGGLVGRVYLYTGSGQPAGGSITNGVASGNVTVARNSGDVGGLIGYLGASSNAVGPVNDSRASGNVSGGSSTGGLIGTFQNSSGFSAVLNSSASGSVTGSSTVGGLVGSYSRSTANGRADDITNSFATGNVSGNTYLGGLVGEFTGNFGIAGSYATGNVTARDVTGSKYMGGLVGFHNARHTSTTVLSTISTSYATGQVRLGPNPVITAFTDIYAGGLVGYLTGSLAANAIVDAYATGAVTLASTNGRLTAGGLVGYSTSGQGGLRTYASGAVSATGGNTRTTGGLLAARGTPTSVFTESYWNSTTTGQASSLGGGTARTAAEMLQANTFSSWNPATTGAGGTTWRIYDGYTAPLLSRFLTPRTLSLADATKVYDGTRSFGNAALTATNGGISFPDRIFVATPSADVGVYNITAAGVYSVQNGYDLTVTGASALTVTPRALTLAGVVADKVYDGTRTATLLGTAQPTGMVAGEALTVNIAGASAVFDTKNVGQGKTVTITGLSLADGPNPANGKASNYQLADSSTSSANVTPATLNAGGFTATNRAYDGSTTVAVSAAGGTVSGIFGNDDVSVGLGSVSNGSIADKNVGTAKAVTVLGATLSGADAGNYVIGGINNVTVDITPRTLTVNGLVANNRVYNQQLTVSVPTTNGVLSGAVVGDVLQLVNNTVTGTMADRHAGDGKSVTVPGGSLQLRGPDAANYAVANATSTVNIAKATVSLSANYYGIATDKVYDGSDAAPGITPYDFVSGISGVLLPGGNTFGLDSITLIHDAPRYSDKNVAYSGGVVTTKTITVANAEITGTDKGNYVLSQSTVTTQGHITPRSLTVSGVNAENRAYDGSVNVNVNVSGVTVDTSAVVPGDNVTVTVPGAGTVVGTMLNKNVGTAKPVTVPGFSLGGGDAGNYSLSGNTGVTVDISPKLLTAVYTALDKVYDGNYFARMSVTSGDVVAGDQVRYAADSAQNPCNGCYSFFVTDTSTLSNVTYAPNAGTNKRVLVTGNALFGTDAANYTLLNPTATVAATITPKGITPVFTGVNKVYDGNTTATVSVNVSASGIVGNDAANLVRTANYADRNAGTGKTVTITDIAFTGASAGNYTLTTNTATTTAAITPKALAVAGVTGNDRAYDGGTAVGLTVASLGASGTIGNDVVNVNAPVGGLSTGSIANKNAGLNKAVTVAGLTLSGADAGNYSIDGSQGVTVNIAARGLTATYTGQAREYNGGVSANVTASSADIVAGDVLSFTQNAIFTGLDARNVGTAKPISVTSIVLDGADRANYTLLNTTATTSGSITPKAITVGYTGLSRVYNGAADLSANVAGFSFGLVGGDLVTFTQTAVFTGNGNVGSGKAVNISNIAITGPQGANYALINPTATTTASITPRQLGVTGVVAAHRVYDGTTAVQLSTLGSTVLPSGVLAGDDVNLVLPTGGVTTGTMATKDAGTNKPVSITGLTLSGASAGNYVVGSNGLTVNITPRALTASYSAANRVYDATTLASVSATSADILAVDVGALGISADGLFSGGKNAGVNKAVAVSGGFLTGAERNNYTLVNPTGLTSATITPRDLTALYTGGTRVYDGGVNAPVTATGSGVLAGDVVAFAQTAVFTGADAKNATPPNTSKPIAVSGITLNGADAANYQLTSTTASASGSITPKSISIDGLTGVSATHRVYDSTPNVALVVTASGVITPSSRDFVAGDDVTINLPTGGITTGTMANKHAGSIKAVTVDGLTLSGSDAINYVVTATTGITVDIAKKALTADYIGVNRVYDGSTAATATGTSLDVLVGDVVTIAATGVFTGVGARNAGIGKPISLLAASLDGADKDNYVLVNTTGNARATITPKQLTPSYTSEDKIYDGTLVALVKSNTSGVIAGDAVQFGQTAVFAGDKNVGTNKAINITGITHSGSDAANYELTSNTASTTGSITPRPLRIDGLIGVAATDRIYNGSNTVSVVVSASGPIAPNPQDLIPGDVVTVNAPPTGTTTGTMADKHVGSAKPVAVAGLDLAGADAANYSITATSGVTVNITPRPLTAVYAAPTREYDGTTAASLVGSSSDIVFGDVLSILGNGIFSGAGGKNAGADKLIDILSVSFGGADAGNYSLLNPTGTATGTITPRLLTVNYVGGTRVYDGTVLAPVTGTADRFVAGDDVRLTQTAVFTGTGAKNAGVDKTVDISAIGLLGADAANYSLNTSTASLTATVTPRPLRVEGFTGVVATDRLYDGTTAVAITATGGGTISANPADLITGDDIGVVAPPAGTTAGTMADKNVGSNKPVTVNGITLSGSDAGNYVVAAASGVTVNITPKPLNAVYTGISRVYDGTAIAFITGTSADLVLGDTVSITGSGLFTGANAKNVGIGKAISITGGALGGVDALNYTLLNASGSATADVTPKTLVASYTGGTRVYDGSTAAPVTGTLDGLIAGDDLGFSQTAVFTGSGARNVGDGKAVLVTGITLSGSDAVNYSLLAGTVSTVATVTARLLNITGLSGLQAVDRVYDGTRDVAITGSLVIGNTAIDVVPGDDVSLNLPASNVNAGSMLDKGAGTAKAVVVQGLSLSGADAANYQIIGTAGLTVNIAPRPVVLLGVSAQDRVYDGSTLVAINSAGGSLTGVLAGDDLQLRSTGATGTMADKHAGSNKAVTVSGLSFEGADVGNYTVDSTGLVVNITPRSLLASVTATDKVYDGNANAAITLLSNAIAGDSLSLTASSALFASANAGNALAVTVNGVALSGADASNYSFTPGTLTTTANIQRRPLTVAANTLSKIYGETLSLPSNNFSTDGLVPGESLGTVVLASAGTAANANAGTYTLSIGGAGGGSFNPDNYLLTYVNSSLQVTPRPLTIAANSLVRFADQANPASFGYSTSIGGLAGGDSLASVLVTAPAASVGAPGVSVFDLQPAGAVFASGSASNYAITYGRGVLLVLPTPPRVDDVNAGGEPSGTPGFAVELDPAELERALGALTRTAGVVAQPRNEDGTPAVPLPANQEATAAAIAALLSGDGGRINLPELQRLPLISFDPDLRRRLAGARAPAAAPALAPAPAANRPAL